MKSLITLMRHTARDFIDALIPRGNLNTIYNFAFLVHPRDERDMLRRFPFLKSTPAWLRQVIQHYFWPVTVSNITGLKSQQENEDIEGYVISIPMTADEMLKNRGRAKRQIQRATRLARNKGAKIIGLGALTSSLSRGGLDLIDIPGIAVTTGHAYTGHTVTQSLLTQLEKAEVTYTSKKYPVAIVGAAGSIGSISAEILAQMGVQSLILIDIERKLGAVKELQSKLLSKHPNIKLTCSADMSLLKSAIGVITATNSPDALLKNEHVSPGTIIVDDAQPSDIAPELYKRKDILVLEAGAVHTPNISTNFNMGLANRNDNFCCLAEVLILASTKHSHNFVINRATLKDVMHIREEGEKLGFKLAQPQNEKGMLSEEQLEHVGILLRARCLV